MSTPALSTGSALQIDDIDFSFAARSGGVDGPLYKEFSLHIAQGSIDPHPTKRKCPAVARLS